MATRREQKMQKLADEIATIDRTRIREQYEVLTPAEAQFLSLADARGKVAHRSGWPDFLVEDPRNGSIIGVEVKRGDEVRPSQEKMFAALERAGISVFVWTPSEPQKLMPWRRYVLTPKKGVRGAGGLTGPSRAQRRHRGGY